MRNSIIAVHGLAADPVYTWIKKVPNAPDGIGRLNGNGFREVVWLKHLLPGTVPNARVLKYNYDSQWLANAPKENLRSLGDRLVRAIEMQTEDAESPKRPIIFIGHSFGGVVIEEVSSFRPVR